jgi:ribosomal protein S18 acetylase RimI-like enzyme
MAILDSTSRLSTYFQRHGLRATIGRAQDEARRVLFAGRMAVFYCNLDAQKLRAVTPPAGFTIERAETMAELGTGRYQQVVNFWNPKLADRNIRERFSAGASLWLVMSGNEIAGFGWTICGRAIEPYYFPMGPEDVQLFDFYVVPRFRGRAIHWMLTAHILYALAAEGKSRAFADTGEWNQAQLASFKMTPLRFLGFVRTYKLFGRLFTRWVDGQPVYRQFRRSAPSARGTDKLRPSE